MKKSSIFLLIALTVIITAMIFMPQTAYLASHNGLRLWATTVAPALLPFFICFELLISQGAACHAGKILEPIMRPLFNLPGSAALAIVMGYTSGFPSGAAATASLREQRAVSREEAERLVAFTNNAGPVYIGAGVAAAILGCPAAAPLLAGVHYLSNLAIGIALGLISRKNRRITGSSKIVCAPLAMNATTNFGTALKEASRKAVFNITLIGAYMAFFSVCCAIISQTGVIELIFGANAAIATALVKGLFEMSIGVNGVGDLGLPLTQTIPLISMVLAFGGLSVQCQVAAMVSHTDIRIGCYLVCRIVQAIVAYIAARICCCFLILPSSTMPILSHSPGFFDYLYPSAVMAVILFLILAVCAKLGYKNGRD